MYICCVATGMYTVSHIWASVLVVRTDFSEGSVYNVPRSVKQIRTPFLWDLVR